MIAQSLRQVLEATGYLVNGMPAHGVYLEDDARSRCQGREFEPDALWRSDSALTVYFKLEPEVPVCRECRQVAPGSLEPGFCPSVMGNFAADD